MTYGKEAQSQTGEAAIHHRCTKQSILCNLVALSPVLVSISHFYNPDCQNDTCSQLMYFPYQEGKYPFDLKLMVVV